MVVANTSSVTPAARIFTLGYELGHLICRIDATCADLNPDVLATVGVERWCLEFSAALLMPAAVVTRLLHERHTPRGEAWIDDARVVMTRLKVSARAAANRLIELGWAQRSLYRAVEAVFVSSGTRGVGTPRSPIRSTARLRSYGPRVIGAVFDALPPRDALNVLWISVDDARVLADQIPGLHVP